jgi:hypothetical protein
MLATFVTGSKNHTVLLLWVAQYCLQCKAANHYRAGAHRANCMLLTAGWPSTYGKCQGRGLDTLRQTTATDRLEAVCLQCKAANHCRAGAHRANCMLLTAGWPSTYGKCQGRGLYTLGQTAATDRLEARAAWAGL